MSQMTKFLKQSCVVEPYQLDDQGHAVLNMFGEIQYQPCVTCRCRHELACQDVLTSNGSIVKSASRYFLDGDIEVKADYKIDGKVVLTVSAYVDSRGSTIGYEVFV